MKNYDELVDPLYETGPSYAYTLGPEVAEIAALANFAPDPEQEVGLNHIFGRDANGMSTAFEYCIICARQNLKTGLFKQAALGYLFVTEERTVTWSAHEFSTTLATMQELTTLIESSRPLRRRIKKLHTGSGREAIELTTGQILKFRARTNDGGRGLAADKVILDEAYALQPSHIGSLMPLLTSRPDPQLLYGSSAGKLKSDFLRTVRNRGRAAVSPRLAYTEYGSARRACEDPACSHIFGEYEGCQLDSRENWKAANPMLGRRRPDGTGITVRYVEGERESMPVDEFARERLSWWEDPGTVEIFGTGQWEKGALEARPEELQLTAIAIAVSLDSTWSSIVGAADNNGDAFVKVLRHSPGTGGIVEHAKYLQDLYDVDVVIDGRGPSAVLIPHLEKEGVRLTIASTVNVLDAFQEMDQRVKDGTFTYMKTKELEDAVSGAAKRYVGDRAAVGRKLSTSIVAPLEAASLAAWRATVAPAEEESSYEENDLMIV